MKGLSSLLKMSALAALVLVGLVATDAVSTAQAAVAALHPLHTSITDAVHDRNKKTLTMTVRVFADDFLGALPSVPGRAKVAPAGAAAADWHSTARAYLARTVAVSDARGNPLALSSCGMTQAGDVLILCLRASGVADVRGLKISNTILFEKFEDQLSIVRITARDKSRTFILTRKSASATID